MPARASTPSPSAPASPSPAWSRSISKAAAASPRLATSRSAGRRRWTRSPRRCAGLRWTRRPRRPARRSTSTAPPLSAEPSPAPPSQRLHWIVWLFAIVGALGIIAFVAFVLLISTLERHREPAEVVAEASAARFVVRDAEPIAGTNLVRITIAVGPEGSPYSSRRGDDERNILLLDRASGAVRRLL